MVHRSSVWLGYSWELSDIVEAYGVGEISVTRDQIREGVVVRGFNGRRDKFRLRGGPAREELQWMRILSLLRKVCVPPSMLYFEKDRVCDFNREFPNHGPPQVHIHGSHNCSHPASCSGNLGCLSSQDILKSGLWPAQANSSDVELDGKDEGLVSNDCSDSVDSTTPLREPMSSSVRHTDKVVLRELLWDLQWPLSAVHDIDGIHSLNIAWEKVPDCVDPVRGGWYKSSSSTHLVGNSHAQTDSGEHQQKSDIGSILAGADSNADVDQFSLVCDVDCQPRMADAMHRGERKRWQVEKIASALKMLDLEVGSKVVDFGCGSGAVSLPLATLFPQLSFVAVDCKHKSIMLLEQRAAKANLQNLRAVHERIEKFSESFHACVALHACGMATDLALLQCLKNRASYVVSPCCVGKLQGSYQCPFVRDTTHSRSENCCPLLRHVHANGVTHQADRQSVEKAEPILNMQDSKHLLWTNISSRPFCTNPLLFSSVADKTNLFGVNVDLPSEPSQGCISKDESSSSVNLEGFGSMCPFSYVRKGVRSPSQGQALSKDVADTEVGNAVGYLSLMYPRSKWLQSSLSRLDYDSLARAADWSSYKHESSSSQLHYLCKVVLELDRNEASREHGYVTTIFSLSNSNAGTVGIAHILVGKPLLLS